jgi:hypothetical protein
VNPCCNFGRSLTVFSTVLPAAVPWSVSELGSEATLTIYHTPAATIAHHMLFCPCFTLPAAVPWSVSELGSPATLTTQVPEARGSGQYGMSLEATDNQPIVLTSPAVTLDEGR